MEDFCDFLSGWGAGVVGLVVGHPMDTIKTNQQMTNAKVSNGSIALDIINREGVRGLYKGMLFPLLCAGTLNSVFFGIYGSLLRALQAGRGNEPDNILPTRSGYYWDTFIAGSVGGIGQVAVACPSEVVKVRMQAGGGIFNPKDLNNPNRRPSAMLTGVDIYKKNGIQALYIGLIPMMWRDVIASGVYILSYQYLRYNMHGKLDLNPGAFETLMAGGIAGLLSWVPVVPFDTIKSRMQADDVKNPTYKGMMDCGKRLIRDGGFNTFFKGFLMISLRSFPVNAAIFFSYETMLDCCRYLIIVHHLR